MDEMLNKYRAYLSAMRMELTKRIEKLEQEQRHDEANLCKVRLNIVQIFDTLCFVDGKAASTWADFCSRHLPRFQIIPAPWKARLETARMHDDLSVQIIEEAKLETASKIEQFLTAIKE